MIKTFWYAKRSRQICVICFIILSLILLVPFLHRIVSKFLEDTAHFFIDVEGQGTAFSEYLDSIDPIYKLIVFILGICGGIIVVLIWAIISWIIGAIFYGLNYLEEYCFFTGTSVGYVGGIIGWYIGYPIACYTVRFIVLYLTKTGRKQRRKYATLRNKEKRRQKQIKWGKKVPKITVPTVFDKKQITLDLRRYKSDKGLVKAYVTGVVDNIHTGNEIRFLRKQLELLGISEQYLQKILDLKELEAEYERFDRVQEFKDKDAQMTLRQRQREEEMEEMDLEMKKLESEERRASIKKRSEKPETPDSEKLMRDSIAGIKEKLLTIEQAKAEIRKRHPEDAEEILLEFRDMLVDEKIIGGDYT